MTPNSLSSSPKSDNAVAAGAAGALNAGSETHRHPQRLPWVLTGRVIADASIHEVPISVIPFTVGRHPDNLLCLANSTVSGRHAELLLIDGELYLRDLQSTNGTLLNGLRVHDPARPRSGDTIHFGTAMYTIVNRSTLAPEATVAADIADEALAQLQFDRLLHEPELTPFFQPVVRLATEEHVGYEVLARSRLVGLEFPATMFRIAAERGEEGALSRLARQRGVSLGQVLDPRMQLYLNAHPAELKGAELFDSLERLREEFPQVPLVLEIHEASVTSSQRLRQVRDLVNRLGILLAYDDFGAGQARLMELAEVPPDILKFDMTLIQGIAGASTQRRALVSSLIQIVRELQVAPLAEGIETREDAAVCRELGFELGQGYLYGRASPAKTWVAMAAASASRARQNEL